MLMLAVGLVLAPLLPARSASLDDLAVKTCDELDQQLAHGSDAIALFNTTSQASVEDFHAGRHEQGCRSFQAVHRFVGRVIAKLGVCAVKKEAEKDQVAAAEDRKLLAGFVDLLRQLDRIDLREGCTPKS